MKKHILISIPVGPIIGVIICLLASIILSLCLNEGVNGVRSCNITKLEKVCQVNNSITFSEELVGHEEFLNRIIEDLGIIIDRRPKEKPRKMEN